MGTVQQWVALGLATLPALGFWIWAVGSNKRLERNWRIHRRLHFWGWSNERAANHYNARGWNGRV